MHSIRKQSGHAAMLFAMMIPAFFGIFTLASDGARALQSKARLEDAAEAAVLAIAAHNADNSGSSSGSAINKKIASDWIGQYMQDMQAISDIKITKLNCNDIAECKEGLENGESRYFQYEILAKTNHLSWFPGNNSTAGFGESFDVVGSATARKFQSESVDVMFVSDFSGSMNNKWSGGSNSRRYKDLIKIIGDVIKELDKFNNAHTTTTNRVGFTGFNTYTRKTADNSCYQDQYDRSAGRTVNKIFEVKGCKSRSSGGAKFHDIAMTDNYNEFKNTIKYFKPGGGTASYQGIIRGAQMMDAAPEPRPRRIMIILSDGIDSKRSRANKLVEEGMCSKILLKLGNANTSDGKAIKTKMAVVGFDYNPASNPSLAKCVGEHNVYGANNPEDVLNKVLELISEEIGHLK